MLCPYTLMGRIYRLFSVITSILFDASLYLFYYLLCLLQFLQSLPNLWVFYLPASSLSIAFPGITWACIQPCCQYISISISIVYALFEFQDFCIFLKYETLFFLHHVQSFSQYARVTLKIFTPKSGMYAVSVHVYGQNLPSIFVIPSICLEAKPVLVLLFTIFNPVFNSCRFFMFFRLFTICDIYPELAMDILFIYLFIFTLTHQCVISKTYLVMDCIWNNILFLFSSSSFLFFQKYFFCYPSCYSTCILARTFSCVKILQYFIHISCITCITCFLFSLHNLHSCGRMYHICSTFP